MQLPDFIRTMLGFQAKVEKHFEATEKLATSEAARVAAEESAKLLRTELDQANTDLTKARADLAAASAEVVTLKAQVSTTKGEANRVIAAQGLDPAILPAAETASGVQVTKESAWDKYQRLQSENPREAGAFWATDSKAILESRPK